MPSTCGCITRGSNPVQGERFRNCALAHSVMHNAGARISPIFCTMTNPYAHDPDCDFWFDHYPNECTCRPVLKPPAADPAQDLRAIRAEIAELRRRIDQLEARVAGITAVCTKPNT